MAKLVLIDGLAVLHRAYHALPPLTTRNGEPINAVYGFVSMLLKVVQDLKPTHLAIAMDLKQPTFRHKAFKDYQGHRPEMDKDLSSQLEKAYQVAKAFAIPVYSKAGYEADDIIGTLAKQTVSDNKQEINEVIIVTGDRDILQLVNEKVRVYLPVRGLSEAKLMGEDDVVEKLGVRPERIVDYKALVGDPSDNYPGVKGIGPKTALKLLAKFKTFKGVYENLGKIDEKTRDLLKKGKKSGELSYKLAKIVNNLPLKVDYHELANWSVYNIEVEEVFGQFGFKTLIERASKVAKERISEKQLNLI